jgi:hypothetical protein
VIGGGWLRLIITRLRTDAVVIGVAWLVILATVALLAASAIYAEAVGRSGLTARLARADVLQVGIQVRAGVPAGALDAADQAATREIDRALAPAGGTIHRLGRSESFDIGGRSADARELTVLGFADGLVDHARLVGGNWPSGGHEPLEVAMSGGAARELGASIDDLLRLTSRLDSDHVVEVRVAGVFEPNDPAAAFWWADPLELSGRMVSGSFTTLGPLYLPRADFVHAAGGRASLFWRVEPEISAIDAESIGSISRSIAGLGRRLDGQLSGGSVDVQTGLPALLADAGSSLQVSRSGIMLLDLQLGLLGLYALAMLSALIVDQRRIDTALLRSRGASGRQVTLAGLVEAVILVAPAVLVGPALALVLLGGFSLVGPLADIGVTLAPRLTDEALLLAVAAGLVCIVALLLPQVAAGGPLAGVRRRIGRQLQRTAAHRLGLDLVFLALAALALWQLNQQGTPLTRTLRGSLGIDPLLVAAPMIGLLAGALLSLRLLPLAARAAERLAARRRGPAIGARQLARRSVRYSRAVLLLIAAAAVTVFAGAYGATSARSQQDQVEYATGADVRLVLATGEAASSDQLRAVADGLDGVTATMPVAREGYRLGQQGIRGSLLAIDARRGGDVLRLRPDLAAVPLEELMSQIRNGAHLPGQPIPAGATDLSIDLRGELRSVAGGEPVPLPASWRGLTTTAVLLDESGLLQLVASAESLGPDGGRQVFSLPAASGGRLDSATLDRAGGGWSLIAVELGLRGAGDGPIFGELALTELSAAMGPGPAPGQWQQLPFEAQGWQSARFEPDGTAAVLEGPEAIPAGVRMLLAVPLPSGGRVAYSIRAPGVRASSAEPLPALVNPQFLALSGAELGDPVTVGEAFGAARTFSGRAQVTGFPTLDPDAALAVVDLALLSAADYATNRAASPAELWLAAPDADPRVLRRSVEELPVRVQLAVIAAEDIGRRLTDPLSVGTAGALVLGTVAALLFAAIGFLVNAAVAARERTIELGLLQALGASRRQLVGAMALEGAFLLVISICLGICVGIALALIALPTATLTELGGRPIPPAVPVWPLEPLVVLAALAASLLAVSALLYRRWLASSDLAGLLRMREE